MTNSLFQSLLPPSSSPPRFTGSQFKRRCESLSLRVICNFLSLLLMKWFLTQTFSILISIVFLFYLNAIINASNLKTKKKNQKEKKRRKIKLIFVYETSNERQMKNRKHRAATAIAKINSAVEKWAQLMCEMTIFSLHLFASISKQFSTKWMLNKNDIKYSKKKKS